MICANCKQELVLGPDSRYHHYYLMWDGKCKPQAIEKELK